MIYLPSRFEGDEIGGIVNNIFNRSITDSSILSRSKDFGSPLFSITFIGLTILKKLKWISGTHYTNTGCTVVHLLSLIVWATYCICRLRRDFRCSRPNHIPKVVDRVCIEHSVFQLWGEPSALHQLQKGSISLDVVRRRLSTFYDVFEINWSKLPLFCGQNERWYHVWSSRMRFPVQNALAFNYTARGVWQKRSYFWRICPFLFAFC